MASHQDATRSTTRISRYLDISRLSKVMLRQAEKEGRIKADLAEISIATVAVPRPGLVLVSLSQMEAGLSFPLSPLVTGITRLFGVEIPHLHPSALLRISVFTWAVSSAGGTPSSELFAYLHQAQLLSIPTGDDALSCYWSVTFVPRGYSSSRAEFPIWTSKIQEDKGRSYWFYYPADVPFDGQEPDPVKPKTHLSEEDRKAHALLRQVRKELSSRDLIEEFTILRDFPLKAGYSASVAPADPNHPSALRSLSLYTKYSSFALVRAEAYASRVLGVFNEAEIKEVELVIGRPRRNRACELFRWTVPARVLPCTSPSRRHRSGSLPSPDGDSHLARACAHPVKPSKNTSPVQAQTTSPIVAGGKDGSPSLKRKFVQESQAEADQADGKMMKMLFGDEFSLGPNEAEIEKFAADLENVLAVRDEEEAPLNVPPEVEITTVASKDSSASEPALVLVDVPAVVDNGVPAVVDNGVPVHHAEPELEDHQALAPLLLEGILSKVNFQATKNDAIRPFLLRAVERAVPSDYWLACAGMTRPAVLEAVIADVFKGMLGLFCLRNFHDEQTAERKEKLRILGAELVETQMKLVAAEAREKKESEAALVNLKELEISKSLVAEVRAALVAAGSENQRLSLALDALTSENQQLKTAAIEAAVHFDSLLDKLGAVSPGSLSQSDSLARVVAWLGAAATAAEKATPVFAECCAKSSSMLLLGCLHGTGCTHGLSFCSPNFQLPGPGSLAGVHGAIGAQSRQFISKAWNVRGMNQVATLLRVVSQRPEREGGTSFMASEMSVHDASPPPKP